MGQYLAIGITRAIIVNKAKELRRVEDLESLKNALNQRYNPTGLYDCIAQGDFVVFTFFERLIKDSLQPFRLRDAFNIHFTL